MNKLNCKFKELDSKDIKKIKGGGHCYTAECIKRRDKPRPSDQFLPGVAHGVCQAIGLCD